MSWLQEFHLLRPWWLLALLPWALWCLRQWRGGRAGAGAWARAVDPELLSALLQSGARPSPWPQRTAALGLLIAIIALAGPAWERLPQPVFGTDQARVLVLDLSRSMDAADLSPSRLARARFAAADLLRSFQEGRFAVVAFAGTAFDVLPLTDDAATAKHLIDSLATDLMPVQGGNIASGLRRAGALLDSAAVSRGDVMLLTDSQPDGAALDAAQALREQGRRLWVIGFGSAQGAPIPKPGGGWMTDAQGGIALAGLDAAGLAQLARAGGGRYLDYPAAGLRADNLPWQSDAAAQRQATELQTDAWLDRGQWLVWLLLPLAALAFRRGAWAVLALLLLVVPLPPAGAETKAESATASSWWQNADQRAWQHLQAGDAQQAAELFEDQRWRAAAQYRAGNFAKAAELLAAPETADDHYNRGNALARAGKLPDALAAYEAALALNPADEDARFNRGLVEQLMEQQQQQSGDQQQGDEQQGQDGEQQQGQNQSPGQNQNQDQDQGQQQAQQNADPQGESAAREQSQQQDQDQDQNQDPDPAEQQAQQQPSEQQTPEQAEQQAEAQQRQAQQQAQLTPEAAAEEQAQQQAVEQWLRRVPDDPGGLLRRKFQRQQQRREEPTEVEQAW